MKKWFKYYKQSLKSKKRKKILGPYTKGVIYKTQNGIISLPIEDIAIGKDLGFKGNWDFSEIELLYKYIKSDDTIYLVGTHVGTLLVPIAKKVKRVIGYEANEDTFWYTNVNLFLNKIKNTQLFNLAVGNEEKTVTFYKNTVNSGGSKIEPIKDSIMYSHDNPDKTQANMITLDKHIVDNELPPPSGIIMDIEGAEYFALQGMQNSIKSLRFLYIEYVPHHLKNVSAIDNEQFLNLIYPNFSEAYFIRTKKRIAYKSGEELLIYMDKLKAENIADDILFTK